MLRRVASEATAFTNGLVQLPLSVRVLILLLASVPFGFALAPAEAAQVVNWAMPLALFATVGWCCTEVIREWGRHDD